MFRRSKKPEIELATLPAGANVRPEQDSQEYAALDTVAAILRALGAHAFDLDTLDVAAFQKQCEAWALHVLIGAPRPGATHEEAVAAAGQREWPSVRKFVLDRRRLEQDQVNKSVGDLRQVIWAFIDSLADTLTQDQAADERVTTQLERLKSAVDTSSTEAIKQEVLSTVATLSEIAEARRSQQRAQMAELGAKLSVLTDELQEVRKEVALDSLTKLNNRAAFEEVLAKTSNLRQLFGQSACLLMIDLDNFKTINDTLGHPAGDTVIRGFADVLARSFPRRTDCVARYGGDEFAVILTDTTLSTGRRLSDRLLQIVRALELEHLGQRLNLTISVGLSEIGPTETPEQWLERSDQALIQAKQLGRDRFVEG